MKIELHNGNNIDVLKTFEDNSIDSVVTDPPYGLGKEPDARLMLQSWLEFDYMEVKGGGFMGKKWDAFVPQPKFWKEVYRVLKPGGHVLSFYGTRTYDWGVMAMRLAGFEIRDTVMWLYGSGFPKSLNIGKQIDKMLGNEREKTGILKKHAQKGVAIAEERGAIGGGAFGQSKIEEITKGNTEWEGWGTALKPSHEDIVLAYKPMLLDNENIVLINNLINIFLGELCQLQSFAKIVKKNLMLSPPELNVEQNIVQWIAEKNINIQDVLFVLMDTLLLELETNLNLNIVLSWLNTLIEVYYQTNKSITKTKSNLTTELKILNSLPLANTLKYIIKEKTQIVGQKSNVLNVENVFTGVKLKLNYIQEHFAPENATSKENIIALRPNVEPIVLARKPISEKNIAQNVLRWRTGGINIDECRIETDEKWERSNDNRGMTFHGQEYNDKGNTQSNSLGRFPANVIIDGSEEVVAGFPENETKVRIRKAGSEFGQNSNWNKHKNVDTVYDASKGRFPANVIIDGSEEVVAGFPTVSVGGAGLMKNGNGSYFGGGSNSIENHYADSGSASRFFYTAKAHSSERNYGLEGFEEKRPDERTEIAMGTFTEKGVGKQSNHHPTVKPLDLCKFLVRLITPKGGVCLDPFMGSGTTGMACKLEKFDFIGIELEKEYFNIAKARIDAVGEVTEIKLDNGKLF